MPSLVEAPHAELRRAQLRSTLAAGRSRRLAGAVVAAAADAAQPEAHTLPGDPPAVRIAAEGGDAAPHAVVADPAAARDRQPADRRPLASSVERRAAVLAAGAAAAGDRRRLGRGAGLGRARSAGAGSGGGGRPRA